MIRLTLWDLTDKHRPHHTGQSKWPGQASSSLLRSAVRRKQPKDRRYWARPSPDVGARCRTLEWQPEENGNSRVPYVTVSFCWPSLTIVDLSIPIAVSTTSPK